MTPRAKTKSADARLVRVPTDDDLARAFEEIALRGGSAMGRMREWPYAPASDETLVCLLAEMSRHDARLLGVLIEVVVKRWRTLTPMLVRDAMRTMRTPQAMCVVVTFAREVDGDRELGHWVRHVCADWAAVRPSEHFFVDDVRPGERSASRRIGRSLREFSDWGFYGIERPTVEPHRKGRVGTYDARTRRDILTALVQSNQEGVTVADYLERIDHSVSRQAALSDLRAVGLSTRARGPGALWRLERRRAPPRVERPAT